MIKPLLSKTLATAAMLFAGASASASVVSLSASLSPTTLLEAGTHAGLFDGSAVLPARFQITSATYSFTFTDNDDPWNSDPVVLTDRSTVLDHSVCAGPGCGGLIVSVGNITYYNRPPDISKYYVRHDTSTQSVSRDGESASVSLGSGLVAAGSGSTVATASSNPSSSTSGPSLVASFSTGGYEYPRELECAYSLANGLPKCTPLFSPDGHEYDYLTVINDLTVASTDRTGSFVVSGSITDPALLAEITADRGLDFDLSVAGNLFLGNATLSLNLADDQPGTVGASVPEPASFGLVGLALVGMGAVRRRHPAAAACLSGCRPARRFGNTRMRNETPHPRSG